MNAKPLKIAQGGAGSLEGFVSGRAFRRAVKAFRLGSRLQALPIAILGA